MERDQRMPVCSRTFITNQDWLASRARLFCVQLKLIGLFGPTHQMISCFFPGIAAGPASKTVEREFQEYLNYFELYDDPMKFWSCHGVFLPILAKRTPIALARAVCVECVFSKAGIILSNRRLRCSDKCFESQLFGNMNKRAFNTAAVRKRTFTVY